MLSHNSPIDEKAQAICQNQVFLNENKDVRKLYEGIKESVDYLSSNDFINHFDVNASVYHAKKFLALGNQLRDLHDKNKYMDDSNGISAVFSIASALFEMSIHPDSDVPIHQTILNRLRCAEAMISLASIRMTKQCTTQNNKMIILFLKKAMDMLEHESIITFEKIQINEYARRQYAKQYKHFDKMNSKMLSKLAAVEMQLNTFISDIQSTLTKDTLKRSADYKNRNGMAISSTFFASTSSDSQSHEDPSLNGGCASPQYTRSKHI